MKRFWKAIQAISARPDRASYNWGGRTSLLAFIVFYGAFVARLLSPLQYVKAIFRAYHVQAHYADSHQSSRPEFHARHTELYFIAAALSVAAIRFFQPAIPGWAASLYASLLLIESTTWVLYYGLLRRFSERRFALYSHTELLFILPLALLVQVFSVSVLKNVDLGAAATSLFGGLAEINGGLLEIAYRVIGFIDLTLAFGTLLSAIPAMDTLKSRRILAIGNGEVVRRLFHPAIQRLEAKPLELDFFAEQIDAQTTTYLQAASDAIKRRQEPVYVATPPSSHFAIASMALNQELPTIVEKPLVTSLGQLRVLDSAGSGLNRLFAMGYYSLEKALPLKYLLNPHYTFERFLEVADADQTSKAVTLPEAISLFESLGALQQINISVLEDITRSVPVRSKRRHWSEEEYEGGVFLDLGVHVFSILALVLPTLRAEKLQISRSEGLIYLPRQSVLQGIDNQPALPSAYRIVAEAQHVNPAPAIELAFGKYMARDPIGAIREVRLRYERGEVNVDLDRCITTVSTDASKIRVSLRRPYNEVKYLTQVSLVCSFLEGGYPVGRFDALPEQLTALRILFHHRARISRFDDETRMRTAEVPPSWLRSIRRSPSTQGPGEG